MHSLVILASVLGFFGVILVLGGVLSILGPTAGEVRRFEERGQEARRRGWFASLDVYPQNRADLLEDDRLRTQCKENRAGRMLVCCGAALLLLALLCGLVSQLVSVTPKT
jgi:hypothetical protein